MFTPEDRPQQNDGDESLIDRVRAAGVDWSPSLIADAHRALTRLLGDDAVAGGRAAAALGAIAAGRDLNLPGEGRPGCVDCTEGWVGEDAAGHPSPCPRCRPAAVAKLSRRSVA